MAEKCEWKKSSLSVQISSDIAGIHHSLLTGWAWETGGEANDSNRGGEKSCACLGASVKQLRKNPGEKTKVFFLNQFLIH